MKFLKLITLLTLLMPALLFGQAKVIPVSEIDAVKNPALVEGPEVIHFVNSTLSLGEIGEDDTPRVYHFEFTNVSKDQIVITKVITSCGCTTATFTKEVIKSGGKGMVELRFNPKDQAGSVDRRAFVYTSVSKEKPTAVISLRGEVAPTKDQWNDFPKAMGVLRVRRKSLSFNEVTTSSKQTERLVCGNSSEKPLKLKPFSLPAYATFRTEPEVIPAGGQADIVVTIDGKKLGKKGNFKFPIILEGLSGAPSSRTISVEVNVK